MINSPQIMQEGWGYGGSLTAKLFKCAHCFETNKFCSASSAVGDVGGEWAGELAQPGSRGSGHSTPQGLQPAHLGAYAPQLCRCADIPPQFRGQSPAPPLYRPEGPLTDEGMRWWLATQGLLPGMM